MSKISKISQTESASYLNFVSKAHLVHTETEFAAWCNEELRLFLHFEIMVCAIGRLFGDLIVVDELQGINYPEEFMLQLSQRLALSERWALQRWLSTRLPQLIDSNNMRTELSALEQQEFQAFDLRQIAAHGMIAPNGLQASYFSFSRLKEPLSDLIALKLHMIIPHLHQVRTQIGWNKLQKTNGSHPASHLTPRELEVLSWVLKGKTNPQIAAILERSQQTVKHQVASVLGKLNATNRAQAATKALALGIVETDFT